MRRIEYDAQKPDNTAFGFIIFVGVVVIIFMTALPSQIKLYGFDRYIWLDILPLLLMAVAIGFFGYRIFSKNIKATRYINHMVQNGIRYPGQIVLVETQPVYFRGSNYKTTYAVLVNTMIDGKEYHLLSKPLAFSPMDKLSSTRCSVYVLDNRYMITDFKFKGSSEGKGIDVDVVYKEIDEEITVKDVDDFTESYLK